MTLDKFVYVYGKYLLNKRTYPTNAFHRPLNNLPDLDYHNVISTLCVYVYTIRKKAKLVR